MSQCDFCHKRRSLQWLLPFKNWGKSHQVFLSAQSLCHNLGRSWCHEGPWSHSEDTIENLDFRHVSRRELPAIPPPSNYLSGGGCLESAESNSQMPVALLCARLAVGRS